MNVVFVELKQVTPRKGRNRLKEICVRHDCAKEPFRRLETSSSEGRGVKTQILTPRDVTKFVKCLLSIHKALGSIPSTE